MKHKNITFNGFGFPVKLKNVPMRDVRGKSEPVLNYKELALKVISELCSDDNVSSLTGRQVFFLRNHLGMTIREFGDFTDSTHAAVKKWENCGDNPTMMSASTEKMLRLQVLSHVGVPPARFLEIFQNMEIHRDRNVYQPLAVSL